MQRCHCKCKWGAINFRQFYLSKSNVNKDTKWTYQKKHNFHFKMNFMTILLNCIKNGEHTNKRERNKHKYIYVIYNYLPKCRAHNKNDKLWFWMSTTLHSGFKSYRISFSFMEYFDPFAKRTHTKYKRKTWAFQFSTINKLVVTPFID